MKNEGNLGDICLLSGNLHSLLVDRKAGGKKKITTRHKSPVEYLFIDMDRAVILSAYEKVLCNDRDGDKNKICISGRRAAENSGLCVQCPHPDPFLESPVSGRY